MAEDGASAMAAAPSPLSVDKPVLIDAAMSYFSARPRFAIYLKGLENEITLKTPAELGGLKSPTYLKMNPQGKMPILILPASDGRVIPESEVITQYILDRYAASGSGPAPALSTVDERLTENLLKRLLDTYVCVNIGAFYTTLEADQRLAKLVELRKQVGILDGYVKAAPYAAGEFSSADIAMFPAFVFVKRISALTCGWEDVFKGCPNLAKWWATITQHPVAQKLQSEMESGMSESTIEPWLTASGALSQFKNTEFEWKLC
ncbi:hypothetical protein CBR_g45472 [Chara braunii]|uniref:GST N-terminal domain-containing protein n=1 Tax=Chara braunii TaxID=69332 RepID=A0A388LYR8_CHABU|nr:hypothetical protein CBR_g45472 [Chara braunii]|eukprot:GBG87415.1 hypothetical protein CBR_g45472 [Chara braunii]